jgi:hypothetical protein
VQRVTGLANCQLAVLHQHATHAILGRVGLRLLYWELRLDELQQQVVLLFDVLGYVVRLGKAACGLEAQGIPFAERMFRCSATGCWLPWVTALHIRNAAWTAVVRRIEHTGCSVAVGMWQPH